MLRSVGPMTAAALMLGAVAGAQTLPVDPNAQAPVTIVGPTVQVIGTTPLPGTDIDRDKVPANVQSLTFSDLAGEGSPSLVDSLTDQAGSVNVNATLDDPFQPDILYRGFTASPVLGTPQGLAVYQNGVRVNEAFGDTVNWDLFPDVAIDRVDIISANPVFGLNALGGAVIVSMKTGFSHQGFNGELAGGSFGQRGGVFEDGKMVGDFAAYVAGRIFNEDGWRRFSSDRVRQLYTDIGWRGKRAVLDFSFTGATNRLSGAGTAPEQELAVDRSLVFTSPQNNGNQLAFLTLNGSYQVTGTLAFQGNAYGRNFHQTVLNGNTTNYTACASGNSLLCQADAVTPLVSTGGGSIPDLSNGGTLPIGENDRETIHAVGVGGAVQATDIHALFGHENHVVFGGSIDHAIVDFQASAEIGVINPSLQVLPSGFSPTTPENAGFNATPISLRSTDDYYGIFITDTFNVTTALAITASGRYNLAEIALTDQLGSNLSGNTRYARFNPAVGGTYKIAAGLTAYAGYSEGNRAPTPSEIECSNPTQPCLLPSSLSSDPPNLKQVVSHTYEAGVRGSFNAPRGVPGRFSWNVGLFRSNLTDDIYGVATSISAGFFENIGLTRRQGVEANLTYKGENWSAYSSYNLVDATFQSSLTLPSPNNPLADTNGDISVAPGDRLPGIPRHQFKAGAHYRLTSRWTVGGGLTYCSDQYLRGDESNQNPTLPGFSVINLTSTFSVTKNLEAFANVRNLLDTRYATFAQFGNPTGVGAPGILAGGSISNPGVDTRFVSPAAPIAALAGVHVRF